MYHLTDAAGKHHYYGWAPYGVDNRISAHWDGRSGVTFAKNLKKRARLLSTEKKGDMREQYETLLGMRKYGINNVRGAQYVGDTSTRARTAFAQICTTFSLCYNCGGPGHASATCKRPAFNRWSEPF